MLFHTHIYSRIRHMTSGLAAALLAGLVLATFPGVAMAQDRDPAYAEFYEALDPHGEWIDHPRYGETWVPFANEDQDWRPYSRGQWAYTEEHGWLWESDEPFGWVTYHYGRWLLDRRHGWMWVPGQEWGPAWVAWREGDDAIGWAPLPPEAELQGGDGTFSTFEMYDSPRYAPMWMFVAPAMMTMAAVYRYSHPADRNAMYFGRTRFVTHYSYRGRHVFNRGIDRHLVERRAQRPVPVLQVRPMRGPRDLPQGGHDGGRRHVGVYRPDLRTVPSGRQPTLHQVPGLGGRPGIDRGPARPEPARPGWQSGGRGQEEPRHRLPAGIDRDGPSFMPRRDGDGRPGWQTGGREPPRDMQGGQPRHQPPTVNVPPRPSGGPPTGFGGRQTQPPVTAPSTPQPRVHAPSAPARPQAQAPAPASIPPAVQRSRPAPPHGDQGGRPR